MQNKFQIFNTFKNNHNCYKFVNWEDYAIGKEKSLICTDSVMSCLAVTLYDPKNKVGALAHIAGWDISPEELRPVNIIDTLFKKLNDYGDLDPRKLEATLAGEGVAIPFGRRNSSVVRSKLNSYKIPIIGEDLGKSFGRLVFLHCDTGKVEVYRSRGF